MKKKNSPKYMNLVFTDNKRIVKLDSKIIASIYSFIQKRHHMKESGGILIGREEIDTGNIIIEYHTFPKPLDESSKYSFNRKDPYHINFFSDLNRKEGNIYFYIGEWHTHPENYPNYSQIDLENWKKINSENKIFSFQYHIIAGKKSLRIWKISQNDSTPSLLFEYNWI